MLFNLDNFYGPQTKIIFTEKEYLILETAAPYKNEYYDGKIYDWGDVEETKDPRAEPVDLKIGKLRKSVFIQRQHKALQKAGINSDFFKWAVS